MVLRLPEYLSPSPEVRRALPELLQPALHDVCRSVAGQWLTFLPPTLGGPD